MRLLLIALTFFASLLACDESLWAAEPSNACTAKDGATALAALLTSGADHTADARSETEFIPSGNIATVILRQPFDANEQIDYRAVFKLEDDGDDTAALLFGAQVVARQIEASHPKVLRHIVDEKSTSIVLQIPGQTWSAWQTGVLHVFGCETDKSRPSFDSVMLLPTSGRGWCIGSTLLLVVLVYIFTVTAAYVTKGEAMSVGGWLRHADPVKLTAGANGKGSLSKLQILFFSLIVFGLLAYIVMRTGALSDLSMTVLLLLGIAGVGTAASKGTDVAKNRLNFENWAWLVLKKWLPEGGVASINRPRWRDLVVADGEFNVYYFQMLAFSLVVGGALLVTGLTDLASFSVPETLLGILGLSQVVYLGGQLVAPPSCVDLDKAVTELRDIEKQIVNPTPPAPDPNPPADAAARAALRDAALNEVRERATNAYREKVKVVKKMFESIFGNVQEGAQLDPTTGEQV